jgi:hypothetical protein
VAYNLISLPTHSQVAVNAKGVPHPLKSLEPGLRCLTHLPRPQLPHSLFGGSYLLTPYNLISLPTHSQVAVNAKGVPHPLKSLEPRLLFGERWARPTDCLYETHEWRECGSRWLEDQVLSRYG